jgi:release factor glutamine methyltransferase
MNEIESILCKVLACDRSSLYLDYSRRALGAAENRRLETMLRRRLQGEPLQYLLGDVDFMGLKLRVRPGVLVPRPETEILVDEALKRLLCASLPSADGRPDILDIGTGSGNIAIALAAFLPQERRGRILAVDISDTCLCVARANARRCGVADRIRFIKSDLFSALGGERFDVIVSNPPYVSLREYRHLAQDVRREPREALVAPGNGLYFYRRIARDAVKFLKPGGMLFLEIGDTQDKEIAKIFDRRLGWSAVEFIEDLRGVRRIAVMTLTTG